MNTMFITVLPFGLSTSGYIFSKVVREVVKHWRGRGLNIIMYLNDGLGGGKHLEYSFNLWSQTVRSNRILKDSDSQ